MNQIQPGPVYGTEPDYGQPEGLTPTQFRAWRWRKIQQRADLAIQQLRYMGDRIGGRPIAHMIHIGKTGGSALRNALEANARTGRYMIHTHPHRWKMERVRPGEKFFFVLRDPVSRFVSGFYGRQRQDLPRLFNPWKPGEARAFSMFHTPNELALALSSSDPARRVAAEDAMKCIGHIRHSYYYWFGSDEALRARKGDLLFIGFQENLDADFLKLRRVLDLPSGLVLPQDETAAHRNPRSVDRSLDSQAMENLRRHYARDFEFYEKCRRLRNELESERGL